MVPPLFPLLEPSRVRILGALFILHNSGPRGSHPIIILKGKKTNLDGPNGEQPTEVHPEQHDRVIALVRQHRFEQRDKVRPQHIELSVPPGFISVRARRQKPERTKRMNERTNKP